MRIAAIVFIILLLPAALFALPTMGVYFTYTPGQSHYSPVPYEEFTGYVYVHGMDCFMTAAEFRLDPPSGIVTAGFEIPEGSVSLGDPEAGISITYWPPLNGYFPGYNLLLTIHFLAMHWCYGWGGGGGVLMDAPMPIIPHPETGRILVTCYPENYMVDIAGRTAFICPTMIGVHEKSWGAIKSLYE